MSSQPPDGSGIRMSFENGIETITLPVAGRTRSRFPVMLFLLFWLAGWAWGLKSALTQVLAGKGGVFMWAWTGGWIVAGFFATYALYKMLRKPVPEKLVLSRPSLRYDTGTRSLLSNTDEYDVHKAKSALFGKRKDVEFSSQQIETLALRETDGGNRLTIDDGIHRYEIGEDLTEVEREWLFEFLQKRYRLR